MSIASFVSDVARRNIRKSPGLYPLYVRYFRPESSAIFPNADTQLHLTGYPRSANTYCYNIIASALPDLRISTHIHTVASLRLARKHKVPIILLLRDPLSTTASLLLKAHEPSDAQTIRRHLRDYVDYHSYVHRNSGDMRIVSFKHATLSPEYILRFVVKMLAIEMDEEVIVCKATQGQQLAEAKEGSKKVEGSSLPNAQRQAEKFRIQKSIEEHPDFAATNALYRRLVAKETHLDAL